MQVSCIRVFMSRLLNITAPLVLGTSLVSFSQTHSHGSFEGEVSILEFSAHATTAFGTDRGQPTHEHDPNGDITLQGVEFGLSLRANKYIEGFINSTTFIDDEDELATELEEAFLKLKGVSVFSGDLELRAGQFLNRLGTQNNIHLHGWDFADANLTTGLFLGEEGLSTEGFELSWIKDYSAGNFIISGAYGKAEEHEEEEEGEEDAFVETTELSFFNADIFTVRARLDYNSNDFNFHTVGLNFATGDNGFGRDSDLYSVDYNYTWRENGHEKGGKEWTAGIEYTARSVEWVAEDDPSVQGDSTQQSLLVTAGHTFHDNWNVRARYGWVEGVNDGDFQTLERQRLSLALTHRFDLAELLYGHVRLQYNHDDLGNGQTENTLWLQVNFDYGRAEVR